MKDHGPDEDVAVEGIDVPRVTDWLSNTIPQMQPPFRFELIAGGRSNLTYRVTDDAKRPYALRRPPVGHVLATAHDMAREFRLLRTLGPSAVPVPESLGLCEDANVNGAPFYVMEFVEGGIIRDATQAREFLDESARHKAASSMINTLAALHAIDIDAVGLSDFAKRDAYVERQLRRWHRQFANSSVKGVAPPAIVDEAYDRLVKRVPAQIGSAIVHGDFRLDNVVLDNSGSVIAVLDWELCTLGDPLADLGLLMVYWIGHDEDPALAGVDATTVHGFPSRQVMIDQYADASGRDLTDLDFYVAFGYWRLACIVQGVFTRYSEGAAAGNRSNVEGFGDTVVRLAQHAHETLDKTTDLVRSPM